MFDPTITIALSALAGLAIVALTLLRVWQGWLELERSRLSRPSPHEEPGAHPLGAARIELADLKERIRKLEAIASGVDL